MENVTEPKEKTFDHGKNRTKNVDLGSHCANL